MGLEMMKFRKLKALPIPTTGTSTAEVERVILQVKEGLLRQIAAQSTPPPPETGAPPRQPVAGDIHPATVPKHPDFNKPL